MTTAVLTHSTVDATAVVYEVQDDPHVLPSYYFCCVTCGNCGKHRRLWEDAMKDANHHVRNHKPKEGSQNGS